MIEDHSGMGKINVRVWINDASVCVRIPGLISSATESLLSVFLFSSLLTPDSA
jgi:hypothetical protein